MISPNNSATTTTVVQVDAEAYRGGGQLGLGLLFTRISTPGIFPGIQKDPTER
jgi:hypothetical protein